MSTGFLIHTRMQTCKIESDKTKFWLSVWKLCAFAMFVDPFFFSPALICCLKATLTTLHEHPPHSQRSGKRNCLDESGSFSGPAL